MNSSIPYYPANRPIPRDQYLAIVRSGIAFREYRFVRQIISNWLSAFPGDLPFRYQYAYTLYKEGHLELAIPILDELIQIDPEFLEVLEAKLKIVRANNTSPQPKTTRPELFDQSEMSLDCQEWLIGLKGKTSYHSKNTLKASSQTGWGEEIYTIRKSIQRANLDPAAMQGLENSEEALLKILPNKPGNPLVAVVHLELVRAKTQAGKAPQGALSSLAKYYHDHFPACLQCSLIQVEQLLDNGQPEKAVALLHLCASQDVTGQVARRLWGHDHPYRNLWPDMLDRKINLSIPVSIAAFFGWNQLSGGLPQEANQQDQDFTNLDTPQEKIDLPPIDTSPYEIKNQYPVDAEPLPDSPTAEGRSSPRDNAEFAYAARAVDELSQKNIATQGTDNETTEATTKPEAATPVKPERGLPETLRLVQAELEKVGNRLHRPDLVNSDGRFPVYVIMTTQTGLEKAFGIEKSVEIKNELLRLREAIHNSSSWRAVLFYADEGLIFPTIQSISKPVKFNDPWALKLALVDLDAHLSHKGEMIGSVLIVGGPEIVPFHFLPNPVDDTDENVASDNPYSTRDENYFIPEWPVGRLPTSQDDDGGFLLKLIRNLFAVYSTRANQLANHQPVWWNGFLSLVKIILPQFSHNGRLQMSFGYTAAAWRYASFAVFRSIGEPRTMLVSPQTRSPKIKPPKTPSRQYWQRGLSKAVSFKKAVIPHSLTPGVSIPGAKLGYFNLHGLEDAVEWYGQSDLTETSIGSQKEPEYPVALQPDDIGANQQTAPLVVFSEACFGAHILSKSKDQAMVFRFLEEGSLAYVGSTCVSYGAINMPLTAADYLGSAFWQGIRQGLPAGESLCKAKISLVQEMHRRNGYLDGEDQKTLISFVLYGDPLAQPLTTALQTKAIQRPRKRFQTPAAICDHLLACVENQSIKPETTRLVKEIVARYLPGMRGARMSLRNERVTCNKKCERCHVRDRLGPKTSLIDGQNTKKESLMPQANHHVVILSKQTVSNSKEHSQYARLTLDKDGKLLKLVVSR